MFFCDFLLIICEKPKALEAQANEHGMQIEANEHGMQIEAYELGMQIEALELSGPMLKQCGVKPVLC